MEARCSKGFYFTIFTAKFISETKFQQTSSTYCITEKSISQKYITRIIFNSKWAGLMS